MCKECANMKKQAFFTLLFGICIICLLLSSCLYATRNSIPSKNLSSILSILHDDTSGVSWTNQSKINLDKLSASNTDGITINRSSITINRSGNYILSGNLAEGSIIIDADGSVNLTLNKASITNPNGPAIYIKKAVHAYLTLTSNTNNYLVDGNVYSNWEADGVLAANAPLTIQGNGNLEITAQYNHGITSSNVIRVNGGSIKINSSNDCISTKGQLNIAGGHLDLNASNLGISCNDQFHLSDGVIEISTPGTGISIQKDFIIDGGTLNMTDTTHGIHSHNNVLINNGNLNISAKSEALSALNSVTINNGNIHLDSSENALIVNRHLTFNDGTLLAIGGLGTSNGICCNPDGFSINGGTLIATGGKNTSPNIKASSQLSIMLNEGLADLPLCLKQNAQTVLTFVPTKGFSSMLFSSPLLLPHRNYLLYKGGSIEDGNHFYGLYTDAHYIPGEEILHFIPQSMLTKLSLDSPSLFNSSTPPRSN